MEHGFTPKILIIQFQYILAAIYMIVFMIYCLTILLFFGEQYASLLFQSSNRNLNNINNNNAWWGWLQFQRLAWTIWWWIAIINKWYNTLEQYTCLMKIQGWYNIIINLCTLDKTDQFNSIKNQRLKDIYSNNNDDDDLDVTNKYKNLLILADQYILNTKINADNEANLRKINNNTLDQDDLEEEDDNELEDKYNKYYQKLKDDNDTTLFKTNPKVSIFKIKKQTNNNNERIPSSEQIISLIIHAIQKYQDEWNSKLQKLPSYVLDQKAMLPIPNTILPWSYYIYFILFIALLSIIIDVNATHFKYSHAIDIFIWDSILSLVMLYILVYMLWNRKRFKPSYSVLLSSGIWIMMILIVYWIPRRLVEVQYSYISWILLAMIILLLIPIWVLLFNNWVHHAEKELIHLNNDESPKVNKFYAWLTNWHWQHYIFYLNKMLKF